MRYYNAVSYTHLDVYKRQTLEGVIGLDGKGRGTGTLMDYGIRYDEAPLKADFTPDSDLIAKKAQMCIRDRGMAASASARASSALALAICRRAATVRMAS